MATIELTKENLAPTIENNEIVLIDFWATGCEPCKSFEPIFESASGKHPEITFAKVDTDKEPEITAAFGIEAVPTFVVFREQIGLLSQAGALTEDGLAHVIDKVKELDMDEVRAEIAQHDEEGGGCCGCGHDHDHDEAPDEAPDREE